MARPAWAQVTADRVICPKRCKLHFAFLTSDGVGAADATLRDGSGTAAPVIAIIRTDTARSQSFAPPSPIECEGGIFADVGSNVESLTVVFEPSEID